MKKLLLFPAFALAASAFLASAQLLPAQFGNSQDGSAIQKFFVSASFTNLLDDPGPGTALFISPTDAVYLETLVATAMPSAMLLESCSGTFYSLGDRRGDQVQITPGKLDMPLPATNAPGYLDSSIMHFLSLQKIKAATDRDAVAAVQLYLSLWGGIDYAKAKLCEAHRFNDNWVVTVNHDFKNHPGNVQPVMPFELRMDTNSSIVQFRERSFNYHGSPKVYANTVNSTYQAEQKIDGGSHFADVVKAKLGKAWETEQQHLRVAASAQNH